MVPNALTVQFLAWVADRPRTRADVMEAWRSTCPRLSIWEDATIDGLVQFEKRNVVLTARGRAILESASELAGERRPAAAPGTAVPESIEHA